jgi:hypothetical protein
MLISCTQPDGNPAPTDDWTPIQTGGQVANNCDPTDGGLVATVSASQDTAALGGAEWEFHAPPGSTIAGGIIALSFYAPEGNAFAASPHPLDDASDEFAGCADGFSCGGQVGGGLSTVAAIPNNGAQELFAVAQCSNAGGACPAGGGGSGLDAETNMFGADVLLATTAAPTATAFTGSLLAGNARDVGELGFTAAEASGPGVRTITVQIDGVTVYSGVPDDNQGMCEPIGTDQAGNLEFLNAQPCDSSESFDQSFDVTGLKDGAHTLSVSVTDAAQTTAVVATKQFTTLNAPQADGTPSIVGSDIVGQQLGATDTTFQAPSGAGSVAVAGHWASCDSQGNACQAIPGATRATYTIAPTDAGHTLRYVDVATNNDGSASVQSDATDAITQPVQTGGPTGSGDGTGSGSTTTPTGGSGGTPTGGSGSSTTPPGETTTTPASAAVRGAANGSPASDSATLSARWTSTSKTSLTTTFTARSSATGRLLAASGAPISGATVTIAAKPSSPGSATRTEAEVTTSASGAFTWKRPGSESSRTFTFEYFSHVGDATPAATAKLALAVKPIVSLAVSPKRTVRNITLSGAIAGGPIPAGGEQIALQGASAGKGAKQWLTFMDVRTNSHGKFKAKYRFRFAGPGTYVLRAVTLVEAAYPYLGGASSAVTVHEVK